MDAADEAGGETIFSSDGMDPLPIPKVPVVASAYSNDTRTENVYELLETDPLVDPSYSAVNRVGESPEERLKRLVREVESLKKELNDNEQVSKLAQELTTRLQTSSSLTNAHEDVVRTIQQRVNETKEAPQESGIVYELYGGGKAAATSVPSSVEERLIKLEGLVGTSSSSLSILERMERLENMANRVDDKALDDAATRAKVIRADLEAASKARTKLSGAAVSANDSKKISELYEQLKQLEGVGMHLPALSLRLQQLASLHSQNATFANRLSGIEQGLPKIQASVQELQQSLTQVEEGMLNNIKMLQENIKVLETKMNK